MIESSVLKENSKGRFTVISMYLPLLKILKVSYLQYVCMYHIYICEKVNSDLSMPQPLHLSEIYTEIGTTYASIAKATSTLISLGYITRTGLKEYSLHRDIFNLFDSFKNKEIEGYYKSKDKGVFPYNIIKIDGEL